ncbi:MAG: DUF4956 domain-containing protein [Candidatus Omnitrophica bacterium]|nr:DUF4956 domain-containing protein [Candidatus Omnitrophota bacterium]
MKENEWLDILFKGKPVDVGVLGQIGFFHYMTVLWVSLLSAVFIAFLYVVFYRKRATGSLVHYAFPLMSISITGIFICIQFSLPLSLGLLGALSIVRFRTPIKEPEEIGFILLVIATSICAATFNLLFMAVILLVAVLALVIIRWNKGFFKTYADSGMLIVQFHESAPSENQKKTVDYLKTKIPAGRLNSLTNTGSEANLSYIFPSLKSEEVMDIQEQVKKIMPESRVNVFFHHAEHA